MRLDQFLAGRPRERTSVHLPIPRPGEIDARVTAAQADEAEARAAFHAEDLALEADVRWLFDDVLLLDAQIEAADAVVAARDAVAAQMKARLDASQATALDEAMAAVTAAEAVEDRVELAAKRSAARAALFVQLGLPADAAVKMTGAPPRRLASTGIARRARPSSRRRFGRAPRSRSRRPASTRRARASSRRRRSGGRGSLSWSSATRSAPVSRTARASPSRAAWSSRSWTRTARGVLAADAAQNAARLALAAEVQRISREVQVRLQAARVAEAQVTDLRKIVLPASQRASAAIRNVLQAHDVDVVLALMVDIRRVRVELLFLDAIRRYRAAVADLRRSIGGPLPAAPPGAATSPK
jgi:cobalt-zinc-cadmium efflux system outer membrane protein